MKNKADRFYFENFERAADYSCKAADFLVECLENYDLNNIEKMIGDLHEYEKMGDEEKHQMLSALAKAFVTPVDREDLAVISHNIDDVTDAIEEVLQRFYVDQIETVLPEAIEFAKKIVDSCNLMKALLAEFINFKKSKKLHDMIVKLNGYEEECDKLYIKATLKIREHCTDILEIISWREIYDKMEECADACEHVGDVIDTVVMKNT